MAKKVYQYHGFKIEELKEMDEKKFIELVPARQRRTLNRGYSDQQKKLIEKMNAAKNGKWKKPIKTHCRDMVVTPRFLSMTIHVYNGRKFVQVEIQPEMLGHYLGEFAGTRNRVAHSAPGVGATKSSSSASVR
jgi:small subunit ribosomal protein S19